jgi:hypothetical protein
VIGLSSALPVKKPHFGAAFLLEAPDKMLLAPLRRMAVQVALPAPTPWHGKTVFPKLPKGYAGGLYIAEPVRD